MRLGLLAADDDECLRRQRRKPPTVSVNDVSTVPTLTNRRKNDGQGLIASDVRTEEGKERGR